MIRKRLIILVIIVTFIIVTMYVYRPIHVNKDFFNTDSITINYLIDNTIENETVIPNFQAITIDNHSTDFHKLEHIIEKYTYHNCIHTLIGKASNENTSNSFILFSKNQTIIISNAPHIIIDDKIYRIGYWSDVKIKKMIRELINFLNH